MEVKETFCSVNQILTNILNFIWVEYFDSGLKGEDLRYKAI